MKTARFVAFALLFLVAAAVLPARQSQYQYQFQNPALSIDDRVDNIISLLTLDEKIAALGTGAISRLNIPNPGGAEGIHQLVVRGGRGAAQGTPQAQGVPTTSFAQVYGMGETWDPDLIRRAGAVVGYEARYIAQSDKYKRVMLTVWGPTSDLARDPRWGRTDESFGEDPFLTGTMAVAYARGIQGEDPKYWQVMAKLKHLFANSNENTRTSSSSDFDERLMREYYAVPFRRAFLEAGVKGYMSAYNAWNGVPMVVNPVLKNVVSKEWGADWNVSPDAGALGHVVDGHHYYKTMDEVYVNALKVGVNNLGGGGFGRAAGPAMPDVMKQALTGGRITESDIDAAIKGRFKTVIKLGLLDPPAMNPYARIGAAGEPEPWTTDRHKTVARDVARESVVLLKNSQSLLPLNRQSVKSIAVIGPRAGDVLSDFYTGALPYSVSVLQGIRNAVGSAAAVNYAPGNDINAAVTAAKSSGIAVVVVGNDPMCGSANPGEAFNPDGSTKPCADPGEGREGRDRESLDLAPAQENLIEQVLAANPKTIVVLVSSFPYAINWAQRNVPAILHVTHATEEQGTAVADVLFGDYNPSGRLVQTWPSSADQLPPFLDYDIRKGRTYLYFTGKPLYPFGHGLSYSTFAYSHLRLSSSRLARN
ncbi:MAG TPA: glycoside hydrolase family 3 C-terminal domain-containing protein, partial [Vicinamibacterales bacterium]|nr:glycoside hydrolase family 3 C-terminal domain-containing protein [Vicinamibacterales bacterium]